MRDILFERIAGIIKAIIDTCVEQVFKPRCEITTKYGPVGFALDIGLVSHPTVLQSIGEPWVKTMSSGCVTICCPKILCPSVTLCNERNGCQYQSNKCYVNMYRSDAPPIFRAASM